MSRARALLRYRYIWTTLAIAAVTAVLALVGQGTAARWVATSYVLLIAARSAVGMIASLRKGSWGIDVLAVAAIVATVALGDFWAALVVVLMLLSGEALEDFAGRRAHRELAALMSRAPRVAHREVAGAVVDVPVDAIVPGDLVEVRPGETVPVDGALLGDGASFDESSITGESLPVWRAAGYTIRSGTVNADEVVTLRAVTTAALSEYQTIVELVRSAANSKAPFVRLADRVAIPFTIGALVIGALAWIISGDPARLAEVLVVATPCPLLIATPVAFIAGMSSAAARGVIVKGGGVIEQLSRVRTAAFDKTGTLTAGAPEIDRIESVDGDEERVLATAAALESGSAHVLAKAIVAAAAERGLGVTEADDLSEKLASGMRGMVGGLTAASGKKDFVAPHAHLPWPALAAGESAVYVSLGAALIGRIVLTDEVRPSARPTVAGLRALGISPIVMLTGDSVDTAQKVASAVGIDDVRAGLLPGDKLRMVGDLAPRPVLMVGDGVNDAPVLAAADVGIAMGARGATAASESADAVILVEDLGRVLEVVVLARRVVRIAYQSIGLGIGLSVVLMIVASLGVIPAIVGAALQEVVDVLTIANSLRAARSITPRVAPGPERAAPRSAASASG